VPPEPWQVQDASNEPGTTPASDITRARYWQDNESVLHLEVQFQSFSGPDLIDAAVYAYTTFTVTGSLPGQATASHAMALGMLDMPVQPALTQRDTWFDLENLENHTSVRLEALVDYQHATFLANVTQQEIQHLVGALGRTATIDHIQFQSTLAPCKPGSCQSLPALFATPLFGHDQAPDSGNAPMLKLEWPQTPSNPPTGPGNHHAVGIPPPLMLGGLVLVGASFRARRRP
jgi:hypothetical protein